MSNFLTDDKRQLLDRFSVSFIESGITLGNPLSNFDINKFEVDHQVTLPDDLRHFLLATNGFGNDEMHVMSRFWQLHEYVKMSNYFIQDVIKDSKSDDDLLLYKKIVAIDGKWLLPDIDDYFLFADYNVNGSYWAIKLNFEKSKENIIICINDFSNIYKIVATSFSQFVDIFFNKCPEELL